MPQGEQRLGWLKGTGVFFNQIMYSKQSTILTPPYAFIQPGCNNYNFGMFSNPPFAKPKSFVLRKCRCCLDASDSVLGRIEVVLGDVIGCVCWPNAPNEDEECDDNETEDEKLSENGLCGAKLCPRATQVGE